MHGAPSGNDRLSTTSFAHASAGVPSATIGAHRASCDPSLNATGPHPDELQQGAEHRGFPSLHTTQRPDVHAACPSQSSPYGTFPSGTAHIQPTPARNLQLSPNAAQSASLQQRSAQWPASHHPERQSVPASHALPGSPSPGASRPTHFAGRHTRAVPIGAQTWPSSAQPRELQHALVQSGASFRPNPAGSKQNRPSAHSPARHADPTSGNPGTHRPSRHRSPSGHAGGPAAPSSVHRTVPSSPGTNTWQPASHAPHANDASARRIKTRPPPATHAVPRRGGTLAASNRLPRPSPQPPRPAEVRAASAPRTARQPLRPQRST